MIVNTKTGLLIVGQVGREPELRYVGQNERPVLKFSMRYGTETPEGGGKAVGKYIDVDVWENAEDLNGMLQQWDAVAVVAREIKSREYNGKIYKSVSADGVFPGAAVVFRWLQQAIDLLQPKAAHDGFAVVPGGQPPAGSSGSDTPTDISGGEMYPGESLADYAPRTKAGRAAQSGPPAISDDLGGFIDGEPEDLPF